MKEERSSAVRGTAVIEPVAGAAGVGEAAIGVWAWESA